MRFLFAAGFCFVILIQTSKKKKETSKKKLHPILKKQPVVFFTSVATQCGMGYFMRLYVSGDFNHVKFVFFFFFALSKEGGFIHFSSSTYDSRFLVQIVKDLFL